MITRPDFLYAVKVKLFKDVCKPVQINIGVLVKGDDGFELFFVGDGNVV